jgi:hypothetical protein
MKKARANWLAILLLCLTATGFSEDTTPAAALQRISTVKVFAFGGIGYAGTTSEGERDYKTIMSQPAAEALASFEKLYATGNPQAKSYALAGIRKLDKQRFSELLASVRASGLKVETESGCIVSEKLLAEVALELSFGKYDVRN